MRALSVSLRPVLLAAAGWLLLCYFGYHALYGQRGLFALSDLSASIGASQAQLSVLSAERAALERDTTRLRPDSLDLDLVEERARSVLGYAHPADVLVITGPRAGPSAPQMAPVLPRPTPLAPTQE